MINGTVMPNTRAFDAGSHGNLVTMEARSGRDGTVTIQMSEAEAVVLHAAIAGSEFENELEEVELREPVEKMVFSDVQQALAPLIPGLGSDEYGTTVARAYASIDPGPF